MMQAIASSQSGTTPCGKVCLGFRTAADAGRGQSSFCCSVVRRGKLLRCGLMEAITLQFLEAFMADDVLPMLAVISGFIPVCFHSSAASVHVRAHMFLHLALFDHRFIFIFSGMISSST